MRDSEIIEEEKEEKGSDRRKSIGDPNNDVAIMSNYSTQNQRYSKQPKNRLFSAGANSFGGFKKGFRNQDTMSKQSIGMQK